METIILNEEGINPAYRQWLARFREYCRDYPKTTLQEIESFFHARKQSGAKPATLCGFKVALRSAFKNGESHGRRDQKEFDSTMKRLVVGKRITRGNGEYLTEMEIATIVSASGAKTGLLIEGLYQTACRVSEFINIQLHDCKIHRGVVNVAVVGKFNKQRTVKMKLETYRRLQEIYSNGKKLVPIDRLTVFTMLQRVGTRTGFHLHPHLLRHSWGSNHAKTMSIHAVSKYMGHTKPEHTLKYYLHDKEIDGAIDKLYRSK